MDTLSVCFILILLANVDSKKYKNRILITLFIENEDPVKKQ